EVEDADRGGRGVAASGVGDDDAGQVAGGRDGGDRGGAGAAAAGQGHLRRGGVAPARAEQRDARHAAGAGRPGGGEDVGRAGARDGVLVEVHQVAGVVDGPADDVAVEGQGPADQGAGLPGGRVVDLQDPVAVGDGRRHAVEGGQGLLGLDERERGGGGGHRGG